MFPASYAVLEAPAVGSTCVARAAEGTANCTGGLYRFTGVAADGTAMFSDCIADAFPRGLVADRVHCPDTGLRMYYWKDAMPSLAVWTFPPTVFGFGAFCVAVALLLLVVAVGGACACGACDGVAAKLDACARACGGVVWRARQCAWEEGCRRRRGGRGYGRITTNDEPPPPAAADA